MTPELLRIEGLTVAFSEARAAQAATRNVDLTIRRGRTLGLVGESGSGKSVTAMSILGLLLAGATVSPRTRIAFDGMEIANAPEKALRRLRGARFGVVFQDPMSCLNPLMRIGAQIKEAVTAHLTLTDRAARRRVLDLLAEVGLREAESRYDSYPHQLSGGQQQRAMIAMALAADPDLLIADEPTTALDVTIQAQIVELLLRLKRDRGMAMLFISHDLGLVGRIADDIAVMYRGEVVEAGPAATIMQAPEHRYTRALLACRPQGSPPRTRLRTVHDILEDRPGDDDPEPKARAESASPAPRTVLEIRDLVVDYRPAKAFAPSVRAVDGASFILKEGRTLGLVGESGSGKSTIARTVVGLAAPSRGDICLFGSDPRGLSAADRFALRRRCQMIFQSPLSSLNPRLTVRQILEEPLGVHGRLPRRGRTGFLTGLLTEVGLRAEHLDRYPHQLSGGQQQRVSIARALALDPDLLICDEILSALDVTVQAQILNLLLDIQRQRRLTMLFISHDLHVVRHVADDIAVMRAGQLVESGPADRVFATPAHAYTRDLLRAGRAFS